MMILNNSDTPLYTRSRAKTDTSSTTSDREPHRIRKYCGRARDWTREKCRGLVPRKPHVKPAWWLGMQHNLALSPLYQLPEELLLAICRELEGPDVYIMRQTCSNFRRILSDLEFVDWEKSRGFYLVKPPIVEFPKADVDWQDVYERLRRRRCCSACIDARLPAQIGGDSAYDTAMLRLANRTKYCTECRTQHPLIMFSKKQREAEDGAICIMAEGGVAMCPHHTVSLRALREWQDALRSRGKEAQHLAPPWFLHCDVCFSEFEEPLRSTAVQPAATCLLPEAMELSAQRQRNYSSSWEATTATQGTICMQWTMPLRVNKKVAVAAGTKSLDYRIGERDSHGADKVEEALFQAAEAGYNDLICPHTSFDDPPVFHEYLQEAFRSARNFEDGCEWKTRVDPFQGFVQRSNRWSRGPVVPKLCRICSTPGFLRPLYHVVNPLQKFEHRWIVSKHGLALQQQLTLRVPDLAAPFSRAHEVWLQMLSPRSYGLDADTDLQHITWCPDRRCANGRSWATHQRHLDIITAHFEDRRNHEYSLPLWAPRTPFDSPRLRDRSGPWRMSWKERRIMMRRPYNFRGVRFLPASDQSKGP